MERQIIVTTRSRRATRLVTQSRCWRMWRMHGIPLRPNAAGRRPAAVASRVESPLSLSMLKPLRHYCAGHGAHAVSAPMLTRLRTPSQKAPKIDKALRSGPDLLRKRTRQCSMGVVERGARGALRCLTDCEARPPPGPSLPAAEKSALPPSAAGALVPGCRSVLSVALAPAVASGGCGSPGWPSPH
jgi:hypothetical protein